jgi:hypothetical protein
LPAIKSGVLTPLRQFGVYFFVCGFLPCLIIADIVVFCNDVAKADTSILFILFFVSVVFAQEPGLRTREKVDKRDERCEKYGYDDNNYADNPE